MQLLKRKISDLVHYLIVSNEEMEDIMKIVKSLEESGLLIKAISKIIIKRSKRTKKGFLRMFLVILAARVLGSDGVFITNLGKYKSIGTHWIALYVNAENETYFTQKNNAFIKMCSFY